MRLISYYRPDLRIGLFYDDVVVDVQRAYALQLIERYRDPRAGEAAQRECPTDMAAFVGHWMRRGSELEELGQYVLAQRKDRGAWLRDTEVIVPHVDAPLLPPVLSPTKIVNIGNSYMGHIRKKAELAGIPEDQMEIPQEVKISFFKPASCLIAHGQTIKYPAHSEKWDFEGELAIVIGRHCRGVDETNSMDHVFGFSIINDASDRTIPPVQGGNTSPTGKGPDTFGPMGPWIRPLETLESDYNDMHMQTFVNDEVWQDSRTSELLWSIPKIVSAVSRRLTLVPGDVIATGSPPGMGLERGRYLSPGDVIRIEVEGVGTLENPVAEDPIP